MSSYFNHTIHSHGLRTIRMKSHDNVDDDTRAHIHEPNVSYHCSRLVFSRFVCALFRLIIFSLFHVIVAVVALLLFVLVACVFSSILTNKRRKTTNRPIFIFLLPHSVLAQTRILYITFHLFTNIIYKHKSVRLCMCSHKTLMNINECVFY